MVDIKVRFHFASEASTDKKSTIVKVKSIQLLDQPDIFFFPENAQTEAKHEKLFAHAITKGVVKSLKTRNKFRKVVITLKKGELKEDYMDDEGNVVFDEIYLEGVLPELIPPPPSQQINSPNKLIHSIAKNVVLEKFDGKNFNAGEWINSFEGECRRLEVSTERQAEILRLFLEGTASEWYACFLKTHSLIEAWKSWSDSFLNTFDVKNWAEISYAYNFKYLNGQILDFALKKRNLLLNVDPNLTIESQINLIVIALPNSVRTRLAKKDLADIDSLMSVLRQIEPIEKKNNITPNEKSLSNKQKENAKYSACAYCESKGFFNRLHSENVCRTKMNDLKKIGNEKVKMTNNLEIQNSIALHDEAKN